MAKRKKKVDTARLCEHCLTNPANRPRGLCWKCYYTPGVMNGYEPTGNQGKRGLGMESPLGPAKEPTTHRPGTKEKVGVMAHRMSEREELFHPGDVTCR